MGFVAGDANLYRYVGNNPTNATDPTGLIEFSLQDKALVMKVQIKLTWDMPQKWTEARQEKVKREIKNQIEQKWSVHPFVLKAAGANQNATATEKLGYKPTVEIAFVANQPNKEDGWEIVVEPGDHELGRVRDGRMRISEQNVLNGQPAVYETPTRQTIKFHQSTPAHEFGHLLGLDHPGLYVPPELRGPDRETEYSVDTFAMMGNGEGMRSVYFAKWIKFLTERDQNEGVTRGTWVATTDSTHQHYKSTVEHFKFYQKEHLRFLPKGYGEGLDMR